MTLFEAEKLNLDVYMLSGPNAETLRKQLVLSAIATSREYHVFDDYLLKFKFLCVAFGPRKDHGIIARDVKRRKAEQS